MLRGLNKIATEDASLGPEKRAKSIFQICSFMEANQSNLHQIDDD
jgi:hypothetical protein